MLKSITHLLCLTSDSLASDRRAELVMLLRPPPPDATELPAELDLLLRQRHPAVEDLALVVRNWLAQRSSQQWSESLPPDSPLDGDGCRAIWSELAGVPSQNL